MLRDRGINDAVDDMFDALFHGRLRDAKELALGIMEHEQTKSVPNANRSQLAALAMADALFQEKHYSSARTYLQWAFAMPANQTGEAKSDLLVALATVDEHEGNWLQAASCYCDAVISIRSIMGDKFPHTVSIVEQATSFLQRATSASIDDDGDATELKSRIEEIERAIQSPSDNADFGYSSRFEWPLGEQDDEAEDDE